LLRHARDAGNTIVQTLYKTVQKLPVFTFDGKKEKPESTF